MPETRPDRRINEIVEFLESATSGKDMIIGVSGGVDSALVYRIASMVDRSRVRAFFMPDRGTPESDYEDIVSLSKDGPEVKVIPIDPMIHAFTTTLEMNDARLIGNVKSRVRMTTLYYYANLYGGLVLGTTNRSEYMTGYFTKYGDGGCDLEPIMHLFKKDVRKLASLCKVPDRIIEKAPSARLWDGQTDEGDLGMTYEELDAELMRIVSGKGTRNERVENLYMDSWHKRKPPGNMLERIS